MLAYYTKYFPGSFFINYSLLGVADVLTAPYTLILTKVFKNTKKVCNFILLSTVIWSVIFIVLIDQYPLSIVFGILTLRLNLASLGNLTYHICQQFFPTEYRSLVSGSMNFIGRSFGALALILVEYTQTPLNFVFLICLTSFITNKSLMREPTTND